jgi:membrane associated rhomboid family serine protease
MNDLDIPPASQPHRLSLLTAIKENAALLFSFLGVMWATAILNSLPFLHLERFGIRPRTVAGLAGIVFAPFLHAGFPHLLANSLPFVLLGGIVLLGGRGVFWSVTVFVILAGGLGVWLFGAKYSDHIGASGLIFGYLGFLLARGYFERSAAWMLTGFAILVLYGGLLFGLLPHPGVSWQGHLFGFLAGIGAARARRGRRPVISKQ